MVKSFFWLPSLISLIIYSQVLQFGLAWEDDNVVIAPEARDLNLVLKSFFYSYPGSHFFPFSLLQSFLVNSVFTYPFGFHLYCLFLHTISCFLAVVIFYKITNNKLISILIVLLWTVHPLNVETLTRLVCAPAHVPAGTFSLASLLCFLQIKDAKSLLSKIIFSIVGTFFFLASITTYEQYIFFPLLIGLILFLFNDRKSFYFFIIPVGVTYIAYAIWRYIICGGSLFYTAEDYLKWTEVGSIKDILFRAFWLAPQLIVHYFKLFFFPDFLSESKADWYKAGGSIWNPYTLFCQCIVFVLILFAVFLRKRIPLFTIGIAWFFITILPVIQIMPLFTIVDEHYCYLPILGILLSIFSFVIYYSKFILPKFLIIIVLPIFCILTWRTEIYLPSHKDKLSRFISMYKYSPSWTKPLYMFETIEYAQTINKQNELPEEFNEKDFEKECNAWTEKYLYIKPDLSYKFGPMQTAYKYNIYNLLFIWLYQSRRLDELTILINQALDIKNDYYGWYRVSRFLNSIKAWNKAWDALKQAVALNPGFASIYDSTFIDTALNVKESNEAEQIIKKYIKLNPKTSYPYLFAGMFYKELNRKELSLFYLKKGISKDKKPDVNSKDIYYVTSRLFVENKMPNEAKETLQIIFSFDPFDQRAKDMLEVISKTKEKIE